MTNDGLAKNYLTKASKRLKILPVLMNEASYSDVIRESQEIVELALKSLLRYIGIEPPKWHDVGPLLIQFNGKLPEIIRNELEKICFISKSLRKDRELSFYGDEGFIPENEYDLDDAQTAFEWAKYIVNIVSDAVKSYGE